MRYTRQRDFVPETEDSEYFLPELGYVEPDEPSLVWEPTTTDQDPTGAIASIDAAMGVRKEED